MAKAAHPTLTRELAFASGQDAANTLMRKRGLARWSEIEATLATAVTNSLCSHIYPEPVASELRREADECTAWLALHGVTRKSGGAGWQFAAIASAEAA